MHLIKGAIYIRNTILQPLFSISRCYKHLYGFSPIATSCFDCNMGADHLYRHRGQSVDGLDQAV
ncbi:hypothetical protein C100_17420 [Sphingobium sp. C100]|nr:hypothetical protein C100_17420 [Sphingobium sp. C100]